ncbi:MAG: hypothetical protein HQ546_01525 [Planctomycetes bacterium]|nr:hypothetical protein [Planctomycetota bacterium]
MPRISPHAVVTCPENLADDVVVGAFSYIGPKVYIGPGTRVDNNVVLIGRVSIGKENHIYPFAVIGSEDESQTGQIVIGDRNMIREHTVVLPGQANGSAETYIGNDNLLMTGCLISSDAKISDNIVLGNYSHVGDRAFIQSHVWASAFTGISPDVTVGRYSFTSGYAGVDRNAPPYAMLLGFPFQVRGVNTENLKRCGFKEKTIADLKEAFRAIFDGADRSVADEALVEWGRRSDLDEHLRYLVDFLAGRTGGGCGCGCDDRPGKKGC